MACSIDDLPQNNSFSKAFLYRTHYNISWKVLSCIYYFYIEDLLWRVSPIEVLKKRLSNFFIEDLLKEFFFKTPSEWLSLQKPFLEDFFYRRPTERCSSMEVHLKNIFLLKTYWEILFCREFFEREFLSSIERSSFMEDILRFFLL